MTRQEVIFEQRLRLALTIVYFCLATANIILKLKEKKAEPLKKTEEVLLTEEKNAEPIGPIMEKENVLK